MVVYIHGFGSCGFSNKARLLKEYFGEDEVFSPSLSYVPELAIDTLNQMLTLLVKREKVTLVGSSLGGYYATYFSHKFNITAVLVNPAVYPYNSLAEHIGLNHSYHDSSDYSFIQEHIDSLKAYEVEEINPQNFLVLLQTGDEVLDFKEAEKKYHDSRLIIEEGGNHSFENFESKMEMIKAFIRSS
ncbi:MAG TPA: esterase [Campylobacterales bacterium]|nr:esterase [Campylobacterales bacterium]